MKMMFAVGRVSGGATRVIVTRRPARAATAAAPSEAKRGAPVDGNGAKLLEPGDFRAARASPKTVH